jgi:hypothetical protein
VLASVALYADHSTARAQSCAVSRVFCVVLKMHSQCRDKGSTVHQIVCKIACVRDCAIMVCGLANSRSFSRAIRRKPNSLAAKARWIQRGAISCGLVRRL